MEFEYFNAIVNLVSHFTKKIYKYFIKSFFSSFCFCEMVFQNVDQTSLAFRSI